ncbi:hypothetical protein MMC10_010465 [Thelotrema lepadinum]|nr:hypothetical protein [Thelotrema lepadinum]
MRGVGSLSFSIYGYSPKAVNSILKTSGVLSSVQEVITKAQSEPVGVSHSTIRLPVLRRAQNQARGMLTLLNTHRSLMAGQREAEEASAYHQAEKDAAEERIIDFKTRAAAVEAELQKITNPVTDEGKRL